MRETFMRSAKWLVAAGTVSLVALAGCKKDDPASKPADEKPAAGKPTGEKPTGDKPAGDKPAGDKPVAEKPADIKPPPKVIEDGKGLWGLDMPTNGVGFASVPSVDVLFATISGKAEKYGMPLPMNKEQALAQVQAKLGLKSMDWLDSTKAMHAAIWNPKTAPQGQNGAVFIPITGKDKATAAMPETKKADVDGNAFALEIDGETAYLNFVEGYLVVTAEKGIFEKVKDFGGRLSANHQPVGQLDVRVSAENLRAIFAEELKGLEGQMAGLKEMAKTQLKKEMPIPGMGGLDGLIDWYADMVETVLQETEALTFNVVMDDKGNLALPFSLQAKEGGKIAKFASSMANADLSFMASAPKNSWLLVGGQMDPKAFDGVMGYAADMMAGVLKLSDEEKTQLTKSLETMTKLQDGKSWFAFYADGKFPLAMAGEAGVSDGAAYKKEFDAYMGMLMGKGLGMVKELMPPQLQGLPMDDFVKLVEALNGMTKNFGVTLEAGSTTEGDITTQKLSITLDVETIGKVAGPEKAAELKKFTDMLGTKLEFAIAYGPTKVGMAMGPNGAKTAAEIAGGKFAGGSESIVKDFGQGSSMLMHIDVSAALTAFMPIIKEAGGADELPTFEAGSAAGFAIGASPNTLTFKTYGTLDKFVAAGMKFANNGMPKRKAVDEAKPAPTAEKKDEAAPAEKKEEAAPAQP